MESFTGVSQLVEGKAAADCNKDAGNPIHSPKRLHKHGSVNCFIRKRHAPWGLRSELEHERRGAKAERFGVLDDMFSEESNGKSTTGSDASGGAEDAN